MSYTINIIDFFQESLPHLLAIAELTALLALARWITKRFLPFLSLTRRVDDFERRLIGKSTPDKNEQPPYKKYPDKRRPYYYVREGTPRAGDSSQTRTPTYHFFVEPGVRVQQFMAFLIPSLDGGHGRKWEPAEDDGPAHFHDTWRTYLHDIRTMADNLPAGSTFKKWRYASFLNKSTLPAWSRIVFFNRDALTLFLKDHEAIYTLADADDTPTLFRSAAQNLKDYVIDIALIHSKMPVHNRLECRYAEESLIASSDYYDFGLYRVEGVQIVYTPIPYRSESMKIAKEKVFIGRTRRQRQGIQEFIRDYERLWLGSNQECRDQTALKEKKPSELSEAHSELLKANYLIPDVFDLLYGAKLQKILSAKWKINFSFRD